MSHNPRILTLKNEEQVKQAFSRIGVDASGIDIMVKKATFHLMKLKNVDARAANILKQEMLARGGEAAVARGVYDLKGKTSDVILIGTTTQYTYLIEKIKQQPFGLRELAVEVRSTLDSFLNRSFKLAWGKHTLDLRKKTHVMGVLNITPDSFSDGGEFMDRDKAVAHALRMVEDGADIIDIGGESTRPGAKPLSEQEELERVIPVIEAVSKKTKTPISIDTFKYEIAKRALDAGASMINDISGLRSDKRMASLAAEYKVPVVIMHMQGTPQNMQENPKYKSVVGEILAFLREQSDRAEAAGVKRDMIIVDPGIGFGKTVEHNLTIMKNLSEFCSLGLPIAIGTSRKSFIGKTLDLEVGERLEGTAATVALAISQGANIVRVHDVKEMVRVTRMTDAMIRAAGDDG